MSSPSPFVDRSLLYLEAVTFLPCEVRVNDIFVAELRGGEASARAYMPVPHLVVRGENRLTVRLERPFRSAAAASAGPRRGAERRAHVGARPRGPVRGR